MEFGSFQVPPDEIGIPFFAEPCDAQRSAIVFAILTAMRAGFIQKKWKVGIRMRFNFDEHPARIFSGETLPPFIIVHLHSTIPAGHYEEMQAFVTRGVTLLGFMLEDLPIVRQAFEKAGGKACFLLPADRTIHVPDMQAFLDKGIPLKS